MRRAVTRFAVTLTATAVLLAGCGIDAERRPRQVQPPRGPFPAATGAADAPPGDAKALERLCFVRDGRLVAVNRRISAPPTLTEQFDHLLAGPTDTERDQTLTTALTGTPTVSRGPGSALVTVEVPGAGIGAGRSDEAVAYGQMVCTLAGRDDVGGVVFTRDGLRRGVPRGDGSLSEGPLTTADYADIMD